MSASKLSDLLPIQTSAGKPNAYQVFGLKNGEPDAEKITAAMQRVYEGLKESKPTADPLVWKQAAKLAEAARKQLEDPQKRRALDASLGVAVDTAAKPSPDTAFGTAPGTGAQPDDPLASLLPSSKPLPTSAPGSPTDGAPTTRAAAVLGVPPGLATPGTDRSGNAPSAPVSALGTPPLGTPSAASDHAAGQTSNQVNGAEAPIQWTPPKPKKKRRRKKTGLFLFAVFVLVMLGAIVGLLQFLTQGGQIALRPDGLPADDGIVVAEPMPEPGRPRPAAADRDGVLGNVAASGIADSLRNPTSVPPTNPDSGPSNVDPPTSPTPTTPTPTPTSPTPTNPTPANMMPPVGMSIPETPMTPTPSPAPATTPESIAANQAKIEAVQQLIRSAAWDQMKPAADALLKLDLNADQSKRASTLYDIADLATFYRGAIGRGLATLNTGSTFDYVEGLPVIVVEVSPTMLAIQFNKRTRSFTVDDMPPRLTEKITSFSLSPERPDTIAGQALYRLIHPKWRVEYRDDTFAQLAAIDGQLEQVDTAMLQQVAKELFPE
ncbi:hypothetical protein Enr13x_71410 [Stieleria neptunia]|uniref:Uncharacterized protein n=1 Tax=Stieleria neptunia TaxID=2527979 RepID=A0A518I295_9BACT|nr:hypothetical protein [Stieleria neptunia]QDV47232.1 hypothetical protein Enr13x_71410 [Stieleria neptunia]